jgi:hypothetical protein
MWLELWRRRRKAAALQDVLDGERLETFRFSAELELALRESGDWRSQLQRGGCCVLDWRARWRGFCRVHYE